VGTASCCLGAGRVDVDRATAAQAHATTANLDFRTPGTEPVTKEITYASSGDEPVTLSLTSSLRGPDGEPLDVLSTDSTATVPAHGTATATAALRGADLGFGAYVGGVVAGADGVRLTTPASAYPAAPKRRLTIKTVGRDGAPLNPSALDLIDVTGSAGFVGNPSLTDGSLDVYDEPDRQRRAVATGPRTPGAYLAPDKAYELPWGKDVDPGRGRSARGCPPRTAGRSSWCSPGTTSVTPSVPTGPYGPGGSTPSP